MSEITSFLSQFFIPFLAGGLVFFAIVIAPTIFQSLDEKIARIFLRKIFPKLYLYSGALSFLISIILFFSNVFLSFIFLIITLGYLYSRQFLMVKINNASDAKRDKEFKKLHGFSVLIFITQKILMVLVFSLI